MRKKLIPSLFPPQIPDAYPNLFIKHKVIVVLSCIFFILSYSICKSETYTKPKATLENKAKIEEIPQEKNIIKLVEKQPDVEDLFKKVGIYRGNNIWLKYPIEDLLALTKIKVTDFYAQYLTGYWPYIELRGTASKNEINIKFRYNDRPQELVERIKDTFYMKDPSAKWGKRIIEAVKKEKIFIGMNKEQVVASWGLPQKKNRSAGSWGIHEQWVYGDFGPYVYFENNILKSWQD
jgi:hypothetical protein